MAGVWLGNDPRRALYAGLALIVMIECVIAGRVIPAFTMSALPGRKLQTPPWLEPVALSATALSLMAWVLLPAHALTASGFATAAVLHLARLWHWQPWRTRARPILWVLHAAYAWLPVGLALRSLAQLGRTPASAGIHALAVGATAGLIIGMIARTARGHTGRPLQAARLEVVAYLLILCAALVRVFLPMLIPDRTAVALAVAAMAWSAGFALYLWRHVPCLTTARLDGRDG